MSIKKIVLSHKFLYETFFFITGKKINKKFVDKKMNKFFITVSCDSYKNKESVSDLIVSLTSYGERLQDLKYTLFSLIQQTVKPEKIIVWLGEQETLLDTLRCFEKYGVEFFFCKDMRSYTKLIPALVKYPHKNIVTADDDIYYRKNWLKKLVKAKKENPQCVVAHIAHKIGFDNENNLLQYNKWEHAVVPKLPSRFLFATGVGGVLWTYSDFYKDIYREDLFSKLAPKADDVWFYFMSAVLAGTKVKVVNKPYKHLRYIDIYKEYGMNRKSTLASENVDNQLNDKQIKAILEYYQISDLKSMLLN